MQLITEKLCEHDGMFSTLLYLQPRFRNSISGKEFKWIFQRFRGDRGFSVDGGKPQILVLFCQTNLSCSQPCSRQ